MTTNLNAGDRSNARITSLLESRGILGITDLNASHKSRRCFT
jgi:hypothetical protein